MTDPIERDAIWDAIVIGAGPAGSTVGALLAKAGKNILIVDRSEFPRPKVCGSCLSGKAVATLHRLGLESVLSSAIPIEQFRLGHAGRTVSLSTGGGQTLSRDVLDFELLQSAIGQGARFLSGWTATVGSLQDDCREVVLKRRGETITHRARIVIACGGLGQRIFSGEEEPEQAIAQHSKIGVGTTIPADAAYKPATIYMASGAAGYVGVVQLQTGDLDIAAALHSRNVKHEFGVTGVVETLLGEAGFPIPGSLKAANWKGTIPLTRRRTRVSEARLFVLGDAARYVEPFTGEGMAWAFSGAEHLLPIAVAAIGNWKPALATKWQRTYDRKVARKQWTCRLLKRLLDTPFLLTPAIPFLNAFPGLASPFLHAIHGTQRREERTLI